MCKKIINVDTIPAMLAMQEGGATLIELGVPYTDPQADGATIQNANQVALSKGTASIDACLSIVSRAREQGISIPVVFMGYYNPFYQYGIERLCKESANHGVDGFIVVDLPHEEGVELSKNCSKYNLSNIPLVAPTTAQERIKKLGQQATTFLYCVSRAGVTGERASLPEDLPQFIQRIRQETDLPLVVGFGVRNSDMVQQIAGFADGVVVGSAILNAMDMGQDIASRAAAVKTIISELSQGLVQPVNAKNQATALSRVSTVEPPAPGAASLFGVKFGGQYIPETLSEAFREIEEAYNTYKDDRVFLKEIAWYRKEFVGGPTPMHLAKRLTAMNPDGANIWLKREDLAHTGAHKINNAIGQALLAKRLGKRRIIAETGAGQHGVATATACAMLGLECIVYMGAVDCERQKLNVFRMNTLGAKVVPVQAGERTLKEAMNEAMRDLVTNVRTTYYLIGSAVGPHPFPTIVRDFQSVMGEEMKWQMKEKAGKLPDAVVACVGGGSNAIGAFYPFVEDKEVALWGVEAAGRGMDCSEGHCATLSKGTPGVLHGAMTYVIQDTETGQTLNTHSISAGLDYPGVGPEHAYLKDTKRAKYVAVTDDEALEGFNLMCKYEGIIPALETSHAIYYAITKLAPELRKGKDLIINMSGRGDKDMPQVAKIMGVEI